MSTVLFNGRLIDQGQACIPWNDRGLLFGDGVFTTIRVEEGKAQYYEAHIERLVEDCQKIQLSPPQISSQDIHQLIECNVAQGGVWRLKIVVTAAPAAALDLRQRALGHYFAYLSPYQPPVKPYRLILCEDVGMSLGLKSLAYLSRLALRERARMAGVEEVLTVDPQGRVLQAASANVLWIKDDELWTPSPELPILYGNTIGQITKDWRGKGRHVHFVKCSPEEIPQGASLYICNSLLGMHPVKAIRLACGTEKVYERQ